MRRAAGLVVMAMLAACGAGISTAEVREAQATEHAMSLAELMTVARASVGDYKVDEIGTVDIYLVTLERAFRDTVPLVVSDNAVTGYHRQQETTGPGESPPMRRRYVEDQRPNQFLRLRVDLVETPSGRYTILVRAKLRTIWKERNWDYGQAGLPGWAREETEALQVRIHRALESAQRNAP